MRMKILGTISLCVVLLITICIGCGSPVNSNNNNNSSNNTVKKEIPDLTGEWKQENSNDSDSYQAATISNDTIEIYWISDNGDTKALYWAGSFTAPTTADEPYSWTSKNDHSKTEGAMLASNDDTKDMKYENGIISYEASAMGVTKTIKLKKQQ